MDSDNLNQYQPDYVSKPYDTIKELMDEHGINKRILANAIDVPIGALDYIEAGNPITLDMAQKFYEFFHVSVQFWMNRDKDYQAYKHSGMPIQLWLEINGFEQDEYDGYCWVLDSGSEEFLIVTLTDFPEEFCVELRDDKNTFSSECLTCASQIRVLAQFIGVYL